MVAVFFDGLGRLLMRAGELLATEVAEDVSSDFTRRQVLAIAVLVGEIGAAWPELFAALERENAQLAATLDAAGAAGTDPGPADDPLARNRDLLAAIDQLVDRLHDAGDDRALSDVRRGIAAAAETENDLLRRARDRAPTGSVARR
jgi:hypothetical protein